ncbi:MAG TPA: hypothetical protein VKP11_04535 [Frankiaceae bacterium]|nr:hypothetical protein [Frankiaceae bacterium]
MLLRDDPLRIQVVFDVTDEVPGLDVAVYVTTHGGVRVLDETLSDHARPRLAPGAYLAEVEVPPLLNVGDFTVGVWFGTAHDEILDEPAAAPFSLHGSHRGRPDRVVVLNLPVSVRPLPVERSAEAG